LSSERQSARLITEFGADAGKLACCLPGRAPGAATSDGNARAIGKGIVEDLSLDPAP